MLRTKTLAATLAAAALAAAPGCAARRVTTFTPEALRAEVARRAPRLAPSEVVVPFELDARATGRAAQLVRGVRDPDEKVRILLRAMLDPEELGLRYASRVTGDAAETLAAHEGNCLALASVFVGLARAVGLDARYMDASARVHETEHGTDGFTVTSGHVSALVVTPAGNVGLDFARLGKVVWYRVLDDVEALAHFYNNRGFERLDEARARGAEPDWDAVGRDFERAVAVLPGFARAWSNLGLARASVGREDEAFAAYAEAIRRDPALAAPRNNLGVLLLRRGDAAGARAALEPAARLASSGPHVLYNLALARLRTGDRAGALAALRRAAEQGYPQARRLLDDLTLAAVSPRGGPAP